MTAVFARHPPFLAPGRPRFRLNAVKFGLYGAGAILKPGCHAGHTAPNIGDFRFLCLHSPKSMFTRFNSCLHCLIGVKWFVE
jgi:hypothetical protein